MSRDHVERWLERSHELSASEQLDIRRHRRVTSANIFTISDTRGLEHLQEALAQGKGAILYSGHVYGVNTFFVSLALRGFRLNIATLPKQRDAVSQRRFEHWTGQLGMRPLVIEPTNFGVAVQGMNALRRNEVVTIIIDRTFSAPTVEVQFLGRPEPFPLGPALLAEASGAPLVPFWISRTETWTPQIAEIGEPHYVNGGAASQAIEQCGKWLEQRIRRDPSSWSLWLNPGCAMVAAEGELEP